MQSYPIRKRNQKNIGSGGWQNIENGNNKETERRWLKMEKIDMDIKQATWKKISLLPSSFTSYFDVRPLFKEIILRVEWRTLKNTFAHVYKSIFCFLSELIYKEILDYQSKKEEESVQTG